MQHQPSSLNQNGNYQNMTTNIKQNLQIRHIKGPTLDLMLKVRLIFRPAKSLLYRRSSNPPHLSDGWWTSGSSLFRWSIKVSVSWSLLSHTKPDCYCEWPNRETYWRSRQGRDSYYQRFYTNDKGVCKSFPKVVKLCSRNQAWWIRVKKLYWLS